MTIDVEDRLRSDLPRLADLLAATPESAGSGGPGGDASYLREPGTVDVDAPRSRRSTWLAAAACILLLVMVMGVGVVWRLDHSNSTTALGTSPSGALDTWQNLPPMPLSPREDATSVWTGSEWMVFGGHQGLLAMNDSAAYNPATDTWRKLAVNPTMHPGAEALWTGHDVVVLAKGAGWIYDPAADTWTNLPQQSAVPDQTAINNGGVWTGTEVVVVGVTFAAGHAALGARTLEPTKMTWGPLAQTAELASSLDAMGAIAGTWWDGTRVQVWLTTGQGWAYNPATGTWEALPSLQVPGSNPTTILSITGTGAQTYALTYTATSAAATAQLAAFDRNQWTLVGDPQPWPTSDIAPLLTMAGNQLIVFTSQHDPQTVDLTTGALRALATPLVGPGLGRSVQWTGHELLVAAGRDTVPPPQPGTLTAAAARLYASHP
jgi:hypothetical protein